MYMTVLNHCTAVIGKQLSSHIQCVRCYTANVTEAYLRRDEKCRSSMATGEAEGLVDAKRGCTTCACSVFPSCVLPM